MATWGSSSGHLDDDDDDDDDEENEEEDEYRSEICAEEEDQEECTESSSDDDIHVFSPSMNQCSYSNRKNQGRSDQTMDRWTLVALTFATVFLNSFVFLCLSLQQPEASTGLFR